MLVDTAFSGRCSGELDLLLQSCLMILLIMFAIDLHNGHSLAHLNRSYFGLVMSHAFYYLLYLVALSSAHWSAPFHLRPWQCERISCPQMN